MAPTYLLAERGQTSPEQLPVTALRKMYGLPHHALTVLATLAQGSIWQAAMDSNHQPLEHFPLVALRQCLLVFLDILTPSSIA